MSAKPVVWAKEDNLPEANLTDRSEQRLPPSNAPDSEISIEAGGKVRGEPESCSNRLIFVPGANLLLELIRVTQLSFEGVY